MWQDDNRRGPKSVSKGGYANILSDADATSVQGRNENEQSKGMRRRFCFRCFWCTLVTLLLLLAFFLIFFFVIVPHLAQKSTNYATLTVVNMHLSNATNNSVFMNVTMQLSNAGSYECKLYSSEADAYLEDGSFVGTIKLPNIQSKANKGAIFQISQPLMVHNVTNFRSFTKSLLSGQDSSLLFKAKPKLDVSIMGISISTKVNMNKKMTLSGSAMENAVGSNFTVISAENDLIYGLSQITFSTSTTMSMEFTNVKIEIFNIDGVYVGYSLMPTLTINPGYNIMEQLPTYIDRTTSATMLDDSDIDIDGRNGRNGGSTSDNSDVIAEFLSNFMMGINQKMIIRGPVPYTDDKIKKKEIESVIDDSLNSTILNMGSTKGDLILNGIVTAESQQGWKVQKGNTTLDLRGAYSTVKNILDVDTRILASSADFFLWEDLEYGFDKKVIGFFDVLIGNCSKTNKFAHIRTGYGMYKNDPNKTWVDVPANSQSSFFVIAEPMHGQFGYDTVNETDCNILGLINEPYPCCFLFETLACICRDNPGLSNDTSNELQEDFISLRVESNMTMLIDSNFAVNLTYNQDFFPLYYGKEVYAGYVGDLYTDCPDIYFPTV